MSRPLFLFFLIIQLTGSAPSCRTSRRTAECERDHSLRRCAHRLRTGAAAIGTDCGLGVLVGLLLELAGGEGVAFALGYRFSVVWTGVKIDSTGKRIADESNQGK